MNSNIEVKNKRLKYTSYELVNMLKEKISECKSIEEFIDIFQIDSELLNKILLYPKIMSFEMYTLISKVTNKTIKELTEIEEYDIIPDFRGKSDNDDELNDFITKFNNLFEEIITNYKMRG